MPRPRTLPLALLLPLALAGCRRPAAVRAAPKPAVVYVAPGVPFRLCPPESGPDLAVTQEVVFTFPDGRRETTLATLQNRGGVFDLVASTPLGQTLFVIRLQGGQALVDARIKVPGDLDPRVLPALVQVALWPAEAVRAALGARDQPGRGRPGAHPAAQGQAGLDGHPGGGRAPVPAPGPGQPGLRPGRAHPHAGGLTVAAAPVFLSALGLVNALGRGKAAVARGLFAGDASGMVLQEGWLPGQAVRVGAVPGDLPAPPAALAGWDSRTHRLLLAALEEIRAEVEAEVARHGRRRVGVVLGTSTAGVGELERVAAGWFRGEARPPAFRYEGQEMGAPARFLARLLGLQGPAFTVSTACTLQWQGPWPRPAA